MKKMCPVVHFEMPAEDRNRMTDFYSNVFGWQMQMLGEEMGNYVLASTTEVDDKGQPKTPGAINGGFYPKDENSPQYPSLVISVDDVRVSMKQVMDAGGKVEGEPMEIPGIGWFVSFFDTEGNRVSILQPKMD